MDEKKIALAFRLLGDTQVPIIEVCEATGVFSSTLDQYLTPDGKRRSG